MPINSADLNTINSQLNALQQTFSRIQASNSSPELNSFFSSLLAVETAASQVVSAISAANPATAANSSAGIPSTSSSGPGSTQLSPLTMSALLDATAEPNATGATNSTAPSNATGAASNSNAASSTSAAGTAYLLPYGTQTLQSKPDMAHFMAATGADPAAATQILYGSITGDFDRRDWATIMSSNNPLADAVASTSAMNAPLPFSGGTATLLQPNLAPDTQHRPDMAHFMAATGVDAQTASNILYGSIGSNTDLRDWSAIMSSSNPLANAAASTGAMYNSSLAYASPNSTPLQASDIIARSGNFAYINYYDSLQPRTPASQPLGQELILLDGSGNQLNSVTTPSQLASQAQQFGFDTTQLHGLEAELDTKNVSLRTGAWQQGFLPVSS